MPLNWSGNTYRKFKRSCFQNTLFPISSKLVLLQRPIENQKEASSKILFMANDFQQVGLETPMFNQPEAATNN